MEPDRKSKFFRIGGAALFFVAAAAFLFHRGVATDVFGLLAGAAGVASVRRSRVSTGALSGVSRESLKMRQFRQAWAIKPWLLIVGAVLIVPVAFSGAWMYLEAVHKYPDSAVPLYMFAVSAVLCGAWWAGIYARWQQRPRI